MKFSHVSDPMKSELRNLDFEVSLTYFFVRMQYLPLSSEWTLHITFKVYSKWLSSHINYKAV
jgi:hypothetical protein